MSDLIENVRAAQTRHFCALVDELEVMLENHGSGELSQADFGEFIDVLLSLDEKCAERVEDELSLQSGALGGWGGGDGAYPVPENAVSRSHLLLAVTNSFRTLLAQQGSADIGTSFEPARGDGEILRIFTLPAGVTLDTPLEELHPTVRWVSSHIVTSLRKHHQVTLVRGLLTFTGSQKPELWRSVPLELRLDWIEKIGKSYARQGADWLVRLGFDGPIKA